MTCALHVFGGDLVPERFEKNKWTKRHTTGTCPSPRYWHSAAIVDNQFIVFGGRDNEDNWLNDLYIMDICTFLYLSSST
jgi:hypothetical protein